MNVNKDELELINITEIDESEYLVKDFNARNISLKVNIDGEQRIGLIFRYKDKKFYLAQLYDGKVNILKYDVSYTILSSTPAPQNPLTLEVTAIDDLINVYVNGQIVSTLNDNSLTEGRVGVWGGKPKDIEIKLIEAPTVKPTVKQDNIGEVASEIAKEVVKGAIETVAGTVAPPVLTPIKIISKIASAVKDKILGDSLEDKIKNLIYETPYLTDKEIAEILNEPLDKVSATINKLIEKGVISEQA